MYILLTHLFAEASWAYDPDSLTSHRLFITVPISIQSPLEKHAECLGHLSEDLWKTSAISMCVHDDL